MPKYRVVKDIYQTRTDFDGKTYSSSVLIRAGTIIELSEVKEEKDYYGKSSVYGVLPIDKETELQDMKNKLQNDRIDRLKNQPKEEEECSCYCHQAKNGETWGGNGCLHCRGYEITSTVDQPKEEKLNGSITYTSKFPDFGAGVLREYKDQPLTPKDEIKEFYLWLVSKIQEKPMFLWGRDFDRLYQQFLSEHKK